MKTHKLSDREAIMLAAELFATAQMMPGEGIDDALLRMMDILKEQVVLKDDTITKGE